MNTDTVRSTIDWPVGSVEKRLPAARALHFAGRLGFRLMLAALPALTLVVGSAWIVSAFEQPYVLHAGIWAAGLVFLALALESAKLNAGALLATGLALPALALLSARLLPELAVLAAALVALWLAAAILGRHRAGNS